MNIPAYSLSEIEKLKPCKDRFAAVRSLKLGRGKITAKKAVEAGVSFDDLVWTASAIAKSDADVERRLRLWLADVAAHVVHIFEKEHQTDFRPRNAIIAARQFARGEIWDAARDAARVAALVAALVAARVADWDAARAAARAAAWDAARDADWDVARDAEQSWQLERLVYWFSENNPTDWPLPEPPQ